jgi:hypothetical protein
MSQTESLNQVHPKVPQVQLHLDALEHAIDLLQANLVELSAKLESASRVALATPVCNDPVEQVVCPLANRIFQARCRIDFLTTAVRERIELLEI